MSLRRAGVTVSGETALIEIGGLTLDDYRDFLTIKRLPAYEIQGRTVVTKAAYLETLGVDSSARSGVSGALASHLWDYQRFIVQAALKKRKYAVFADCGMGKTPIFLEWGRQVLNHLPADQKLLIVSPLMVIRQTLDECDRFYGEYWATDINATGGLEAWLASDSRAGIINYDKFHAAIDLRGRVGAVVCDESGILKNDEGKIRTAIINSFKGVPFKMACTATPAPNDREEYANHAQFLDQIRSYQEFFAKYFVNRDGGWELKPHAAEAFYRHLAGWSVFIRDPKRYGFQDNLRDLQPPVISEVPVELLPEQLAMMQQYQQQGQLSLRIEPTGMLARGKFSQISKGFLLNGSGKAERVPSAKPRTILDLLSRHPGEQAIVWTQYDEEGEILRELIEPQFSCVHLTGKMPQDTRHAAIEAFRQGQIQVMVTKPRLMGFGLNLQFCSVMIFSGLNDSYEQFYQAIKRAHRYGATRQLKVYIPITRAEEPMLRNVMSKKATFEQDAAYQEELYIQSLANELREFVDRPIDIRTGVSDVRLPVEHEDYTLINGDCVEELQKLPAESVDFSVFSPPFASLFTYSNDIADMGNSGDRDDEFNLHWRFFTEALFRVMKPGRNVAVHVADVARFKSIHGNASLMDFPAMCRIGMERAGFLYYGRVTIDKNPQAQAQRTKSQALMFVQLERDSLMSRPALADYLLIFKKPGDPEVPVKPECTRDEWIEWARPVWYGIRETNVLNAREARGEEDEKHVCPLQLDLIERCIRLWSNRGEMVLSPFMGIGSEGVVAARLGRRFTGIELKPEYFDTAVANIASEHRMATAQLRIALEEVG